MTLLSSHLGRFRAVSFVEGLSYLALVFIAMPLKYGWGEPLPVRIVGAAHGALFVAFCLSLAQAWSAGGWSGKKGATVFGASLVPFGFVWIEWRLRETDTG